MEYIYKTKVKW